MRVEGVAPGQPDLRRRAALHQEDAKAESVLVAVERQRRTVAAPCRAAVAAAVVRQADGVCTADGHAVDLAHAVLVAIEGGARSIGRPGPRLARGETTRR